MTTPVIVHAQPDPQAGPRPATVAVAGWLQAAVVLLAASLIPGVWYMHARWTRLIDEAARTTPGADPDIVAVERDSSLYAAIAMTVVAGLVVLWFGATLRPLWRGSNLARVLSAVGSGLIGLGGFALNCCGFAVLPLLFLLPEVPEPVDPALGDPAAPLPDGPFFDEDPFTERLYELSDRDLAWLDGLVPLLGGLAMMLLVAIFVLLVVPPSNRWFSPRPPQPFSGQPYPGYAYPAYPYPPYQEPTPPAGPKPPPSSF